MSRNLELKDYVSSEFKVYFISYKNGIIIIQVRCILKYSIRSTEIMDIDLYNFYTKGMDHIYLRIISNSCIDNLKIA